MRRLRRPLAVLAALGLLTTGVMSAGAVVPIDPSPASGHATGGTVVQTELPPVHFTTVHPGEDAYFAQDSDGVWWTWGRNSDGILLEPEDRDTPVLARPSTSGQLDNMVQIASDEGFALGITTDGTVMGWGRNLYGRLGQDPSITLVPTPTEIPLPGKAVAVATGNMWTGYALLEDGTVWAWGANGLGQMGQSVLSESNPTPVQVPLPVTVTEIDAGTAVAAAVGTDGQVYTWGTNETGALGRAVEGYDATPTAVPGLTGVTALGVSQFNMAVIAGGQLWAWGDATYGQVGNGVQGTVVTAPAAISLPGTPTQLAISAMNMSAQLTDGSIWSWGLGYYGGLGDGSATMFQSTPTRSTTADGLDLVQITAGNGTVLGLDAEGRLYGWGVNDIAQLGGDSVVYTATATLIDLGLTATSMTFDGVQGTDLITTWPHATATTPAHATGPVDVTVSAVDRNGDAVHPWTAAGGFTYTATLSFDTQGGSAVDPMQVSTTTVTAPADPTLADHSFTGWALDAAGTRAWDPNAPLTGDLTLYAQWTEAEPPVDPGPTPEPGVDPTPEPTTPPVDEDSDDATYGTGTERPYDSEVLATDGAVADGTVLATTGVHLTLGVIALMILAGGAALLTIRSRAAR